MAFIVNLLLSHRRYFDKTFIEMFLEWSSTRQKILLPSPDFDCYNGNQNAKKEEYL